ncbi:MAG: hypothetical protein AAGA85_28100 [Bacteroidota bacterium]
MKAVAQSLVLVLVFMGSIFGQHLEEEHKEINAHVVAVFPSADTLPANLLRMYVHFSRPMKPVGNLEKIHLVDDSGKEMVGALFNNVYELWNREQTQLTLLLDPARVKTGLKAHEERGRALEAGQRYALVIGQLEDIHGNVTPPHTKSFWVSSEDLNSPDVQRWTIEVPEVGSRAPLTVSFPQILDRLSLLQRVKLTDANRRPVTGSVELASQETGWLFRPSERWVAGDYILHIHGRLEDPAGNNLNGLFDHQPGTLRNDTEGAIETITFKLLQ